MNKRKTGVKAFNIKPYNYEYNFGTFANLDTPEFEIYKFLAEHSYREGTGNYFVYNPKTRRVVSASQKQLEIELKKHFCGHKITYGDYVKKQITITNDHIKNFVNYNLSPEVIGSMVLPLFEGKQFVYNGNVYFDTYYDDAFMPTMEINEPLLWRGLNIFAKGLCNVEKELPHDLFETPVSNWQGSEYETFLWVIYWFAALYQRPGINLRSVPAFFGSEQGIGKNTFLNYMKTLIGPASCGKIEKTAFRGNSNFNGEMAGKVLGYFNEIERTESKQLYNWIKENVIEETININEKNKTPREVLNIFNLVLFSNDYSALAIEEKDRRLCIIKTYSPGDADEVLNFRHKHLDLFIEEQGNDPNHEWLNSLAQLFLSLDVDRNIGFYNKPLKTDLGELAKSESLSDFQKWLFSAKNLFKENVKSVTFGKMYKNYQEWAFENNKNRLDETRFIQEVRSEAQSKTYFTIQGKEARVYVKPKLVNKVNENSELDDNEIFINENKADASFKKLKNTIVNGKSNIPISILHSAEFKNRGAGL